MRALWIAVLLLAAGPPVAAQAPRPAADFSDLVVKLRPSIVSIDTNLIVTKEPPPSSLKDIFGALERNRLELEREVEVSEGGTGFVFDARQGLIVTADYVLPEDVTIDIILADGQVREGKVVGVDKRSGVGLLRVDPAGLVDVTWADRAPRTGDAIFMLARAYELGVIAASGIVAAPHADFDTGPDEVFLMDLSTHRGAAGGPVFGQDGAVVGMAAGQHGASFDARHNVGVAIPAAEVRRVAALLARDGKVERGMIGVTLQVQNGVGVILWKIEPGSSAERAGLRVADVVKAVAGLPVSGERDVARLVGRQPVGSSIPFTVQRDGRTMDVSVAIERRPDSH